MTFMVYGLVVVFLVMSFSFGNGSSDVGHFRLVARLMAHVKCLLCGAYHCKETIGVFWFSFPDDVALRAKWCQVTNLSVGADVKAMLCSRHFDVGDLLKSGSRMSLVDGSIPIGLSTAGGQSMKLYGKVRSDAMKKLTTKKARKRKKIEKSGMNIIEMQQAVVEVVKKERIVVEMLGMVKPRVVGCDYKKRVYVEWSACGCCGELCRLSSLKYILSDFHGADLGVWLCNKCQRSDKAATGGFCKYKLKLNNLDPGVVPEELELGYMELQSVRLIQPFIGLLQFPRAMDKAKGQVVHISCSVEKNISSLGRCSENTSFLLAGSQKKDEGGDSCSKNYSVSQVAVYDALRILKNINPLYSEVDLDVIREELVAVKLESVYEKIHVFDSHALLNMQLPIPLKFSTGIGRELPYNSVPVWKLDGDDNRVEEKSYPNLFPYGEGGDYAIRSYPLETPEYYKLRLGNAEKRFQKDVSYVFRALNCVQKYYMNSSINYALRDGQKHVGSVTADKLLEEVYPQVGIRLRGSQAYYDQLKSDLRNMMNCSGDPQFFISINLRYCPELLCHCRPDLYGSMDDPKWDAIENISEDDFIRILNDNCGIAAKMFQCRAEAFDTFLRSKTSGAFPDGMIATDVFTKIEFQRSGNPHLHCLVWLNKKFAIETSDGRCDVLNFLDSFLTTELPDENKDLELHRLVKRHQVHRHTFTCRKGNNNVKKFGKKIKKVVANEEAILDVVNSKADEDGSESESVGECSETFQEQLEQLRKDERLKNLQEEFERYYCRFAYPHRLTQNSRFLTSKELSKRVRGDRDYTLKRETEISRRIVPYNKEWLRLFKCNIDFQFVIDPWAALVYLFSYVSKPESKDHDILKQCARKCKGDTNLRSLLFKFGNAVLSHRQVGKVEAAMILLGCPLYYCSTSSVFLVTSIPSERSRLIKNGRLKENRVIVEDDFVLCMNDHYKSRGKCLGVDDVCMKRLLDLTIFEFMSWFVVEVKQRRVVGENIDEDDVDDDAVVEKAEQIQLNRNWCESRMEGPFINSKSRKLPRLIFPNGFVLRMRSKPKNVAFSFDGKDLMKKGFGLLVVTIPFVDSEDNLLSGKVGYSLENVLLEVQLKEKLIREKISGMSVSYRFYLQKALSILLGNNEEGNVKYAVHKRLHVPDLEEVESEGIEINVKNIENESFFGRDLHVDKERLSGEQVYVYEKFEKYLQELLRYEESLLMDGRDCGMKCPDPLRIFVQGAAGTGKTYLIQCLQNLVLKHVIAERTIRQVARPSGGCLICAPTGAAAFNIKDCTVHDLFGLTVDQDGHGTRMINSDQKL